MPESNIYGKDLALQEAYASHLTSFDWDVYMTQTFKHTRRDGSNAANHVYKTLEEKFGAIRAFIAVEPHYLDGIHLHSLIHFPEINYQRDLVGRLKKYCGKAYGFNHIAVARDQDQVSLYCCKYVVKGNDFFYKGEPSAWKYVDKWENKV